MANTEWKKMSVAELKNWFKKFAIQAQFNRKKVSQTEPWMTEGIDLGAIAGISQKNLKAMRNSFFLCSIRPLQK